jgi:hypothetical protein
MSCTAIALAKLCDGSTAKLAGFKTEDTGCNRTLRTLPYQLMLVPLAVFVAVPNGRMLNPDQKQIRSLRRWFWQSCFNERYSGQTVRTATEDIAAMKMLRDRHVESLLLPETTLRANYFVVNTFRIGTRRGLYFRHLLHWNRRLERFGARCIHTRTRTVSDPGVPNADRASR